MNANLYIKFIFRVAAFHAGLISIAPVSARLDRYDFRLIAFRTANLAQAFDTEGYIRMFPAIHNECYFILIHHIRILPNH